ncbi:MAG: tetratricopeptide repeat protein [Spirochaetales bacterium]|nr:tetratricopeptide repeat protein [Spirochaetales bacterium]
MIDRSRRGAGGKPVPRVKTRKSVHQTSQQKDNDMEPAVLQDAFEARKKEALSSILFIRFEGEARARLPEGLDPTIPYPVQMQSPSTRLDPSVITAESLLTGMLRVLAWEPHHEHAERYRMYIEAMRPGLFEELMAAGIQKAESREWVVAEELFYAASGLAPGRPEPYVNLALMHEEHARRLYDAGDEQGAEHEDELAFRYYRHLLSMDPVFPPAQYHAAFFYLRARNYDKAVALLTSYLGSGDDEARISRARQALEKLKSMGYLDTLFKEAYDFIQMGKEEEGLAKAREFVERYPNVWNGWFLVGWACRRLKRWEEGADAFSRAISLGASEVDVYNELAICQMERGDLKTARRNLEHALRLEPENLKIIANLGALSAREGRISEALGFFRAALEIDPEDRIAKDWIRKLEGTGAGEPDTGSQV